MEHLVCVSNEEMEAERFMVVSENRAHTQKTLIKFEKGRLSPYQAEAEGIQEHIKVMSNSSIRIHRTKVIKSEF